MLRGTILGMYFGQSIGYVTDCYALPQGLAAKSLSCKCFPQMPLDMSMERECQLGNIKTSLLVGSSREPVDNELRTVCKLGVLFFLILVP
jgi:hypothetical protein